MLGEGRHWHDGDPGGGRAEAIGDRVAEVDLLGERRRRGDPHLAVAQELHDEALGLRRRVDGDGLHRQHAPARAHVVREHRDGGRLVAAQVRRVLHRDGRQLVVGGLLLHVHSHEPHTRLVAGAEGVLEVEDARLARTEVDGAALGVERGDGPAGRVLHADQGELRAGGREVVRERLDHRGLVGEGGREVGRGEIGRGEIGACMPWATRNVVA